VENLLDYQPWLLEIDGAWRTLSPVEVKPHKQGFVARFSEILDRDEAARLAGKHVAVNRLQLPDLERGEYYWRDLEGLNVWNGEVRLGVVGYLMETGADPVLVVENDAGAGAGETLIPFVDQYIVAVDLEAHRIDVSWAGLDTVE
jgi:16S rRNA processing protein RimM